MIEARGLPPLPLDAAAAFHHDHIPAIRSAIAQVSDLVVVFDPAGHAHDGWQLAAIQELAREAVPVRINGVIGLASNASGVAEAAQFCHAAPGITGQIFTVDGNSSQKD